MHGLVERQGLEQERSWRVEPESRVAGATFCVRSLEGKTGLVCVKVEEEYGRVSGTPRKSNSGQSCPGTTTTWVCNEEVLLQMVKITSPSPLLAGTCGDYGVSKALEEVNPDFSALVIIGW